MIVTPHQSNAQQERRDYTTVAEGQGKKESETSGARLEFTKAARQRRGLPCFYLFLFAGKACDDARELSIATAVTDYFHLVAGP